MTTSLWTPFLVLLLMRESIVAWVNRILGTYCKGAVDKKGDKILAGILSLTLPNKKTTVQEAQIKSNRRTPWTFPRANRAPRCLTSMVVQELVFPSGLQPVKLTSLTAYRYCYMTSCCTKTFLWWSDLSTWKYQFSYDHWSQALLSSVSTVLGWETV